MTSSVPAPQLRRGGLFLLLAGQLLPLIDFSIVNVALDAMAHSLRASDTQLELIVAAYGVTFSVCLAMGGRLGDTFGRRRLFGWGVAMFSLASLLCGLAGSAWMLVAARAVQGAAAALAVPQILATLHVMLRGKEHSRALGLYGAIGGLAFVVGQVLGGLLIAADVAGLGWRSVFLINLPIGIFILAGLRRLVPETRAEHPAAIDWPGTVLLALVILCLLLPLALGPLFHWSWACVVPLLAVPPLVLALWRTELGLERRGAMPLLPPALLRLPTMRFGLWIAVLFCVCWSGYMYAMALTFQAGAHMTALQSGNAFIAMGSAFFVGSLLTSRATARFEKTTVLLFGCAVQMVGLLGLMLTLDRTWPMPGALALMPATVLIGFGQAFIIGCLFRISLSDVRKELAGAASSTVSTVQQAALGLGPALFGAVLSHMLHLRDGNYLHAALGALAVEFCLMLALVVMTLLYRRDARRGEGGRAAVAGAAG
jgi:MFS family permease